MKTICTSFLVGAALLSGCTNNEYPASRKPDALDLMSPSEQRALVQRALRREQREAEMMIELEAAGYKVEYGGGLY